jgi:lipopolysaccharide export LptBFGC system permease protein LptF
MSGAGFHVHGPHDHDHELEHAAQHGDKDSFSGTIAVTTAIIATVGALFSYMGGSTQANAGLFKNNAAIKKTEASNQWNYYQAKSNKQNLAELSVEIVNTDERKGFYRNEVERYKKEKAEIQKDAQKLEAEAKDWDSRSDAEMHLHHRWAQATTALQVSIAMAAIALLTRRKWLEWVMFGMAGVGLVLGGLAVAHV